jgi:hypothetical protein
MNLFLNYVNIQIEYIQIDREDPSGFVFAEVLGRAEAKIRRENQTSSKSLGYLASFCNFPVLLSMGPLQRVCIDTSQLHKQTFYQRNRDEPKTRISQGIRKGVRWPSPTGDELSAIGQGRGQKKR